MSQNIFLCLLFVNVVFCYDYLDLNPNHDSRMANYETRERLDDSEMANIDVAGLFESSDVDLDKGLEAGEARDVSNGDFDSLVEANMEEYQGNEDYAKKDEIDDSVFDEKSQSYRDYRSLAKDQTYNNVGNENTYKNLQKKCVFKNMKIPFFSHDKRKTTQSKNNKKRKLFNFTSKKQKLDKVTTPLDLMTQKSTESTIFKLNKRSYIERICPICRRKYMEPANIMHNSRQFYNRNPFNRIHHGNYNELSRSEDAEPEHTMKDLKMSSEVNPESR